MSTRWSGLISRSSPAALTESVEVSAAAALLDSETSTVGQVIANKSIVEMPLNGRNYLSLATLTAGTAPNPGGRTASEGGFITGGAHSYQMNVQVDGLDNSTTYSGGPIGYEAQAVKPSIDAVGEFKVITNNLSAEYGSRMGATVLVTIKSGTNQLHGTAYEFLRNDALDGTNFFANRSGAAKPEYRQNQFGGTLGGPIRKNKLFLFGSFDGTRIRSGSSSISTVPTLAERTGDFTKIRNVFDPADHRRHGSRYDPPDISRRRHSEEPLGSAVPRPARALSGAHQYRRSSTTITSPPPTATTGITTISKATKTSTTPITCRCATAAAIRISIRTDRCPYQPTAASPPLRRSTATASSAATSAS